MTRNFCVMSDINYYIKVVGENRLQNTLLADFLAKATGYASSCNSRKKESPTDTELKALRRICLIDCSGLNVRSDRDKISGYSKFDTSETWSVYFNLRSEDKVEGIAIERGVRGVFYCEDTPATILKGMQLIIRGELWYSRRTLMKFITTKQRQGYASPEESRLMLLSTREMEILVMIVAAGASNKIAADKLCISPHTIKTHMYNIYKKIGVTNRTQATAWTIENMQAMQARIEGYN
jgi:DNA-binding CsgD family transcriptional regulator